MKVPSTSQSFQPNEASDAWSNQQVCTEPSPQPDQADLPACPVTGDQPAGQLNGRNAPATCGQGDDLSASPISSSGSDVSSANGLLTDTRHGDSTGNALHEQVQQKVGQATAWRLSLDKGDADETRHDALGGSLQSLPLPVPNADRTPAQAVKPSPGILNDRPIMVRTPTANLLQEAAGFLPRSHRQAMPIAKTRNWRMTTSSRNAISPKRSAFANTGAVTPCGSARVRMNDSISLTIYAHAA